MATTVSVGFTDQQQQQQQRCLSSSANTPVGASDGRMPDSKDDDDDDNNDSAKEPQQQQREEEQQQEHVGGGEETAISSSSCTPSGTRVVKSKRRNNSRFIRNRNTALDDDMDSSNSRHHRVTTTMALTRAETRVVKRFKLLLVFVLLVSMIGVGLAVYFFTAKSEQKDFHLQFSQDAHKVLEALGGSLDSTLKAVDALAVTMVSFAHYADQKWPFVTVPDFEVRASKTRSLSKAVVLNIYPFVSEENREAWENYTASNHDWVDESMRIQEQDGQTYHGPRPLPNQGEYEVFNFIHGNDQLEYGTEGTKLSGPYLPTWQSSPVIPTYSPYNWDLISSLDTSAMDAVLQTKQAVITPAYMIPDYSDPEKLAETQHFADWLGEFLAPGEDPMEPVSDIHYPIIDSMRDSVSVDMHETDHQNHTGHNLVAFLSLSIYWRDTLKQILPSGSNGIIVVFENPCNPSFTYQIDGPNATYLGIGDLHDMHYDSLVQSSVLQKTLHSDHNLDRAYTGLHVHEDFCPFTIHVYPSADMENDYTSHQPIAFSLAAILIFAVTCTVFLMYDRWVERRQVKILGSALEATFNVGLLEELVRERTQKLESSNLRLEQANTQLEQASAAQLRTFASMSHEIRTPLNGIVGLSSILADDADLNSKQRESINMIIHSGELLRNVVNDVLDYSKLESGSVAIDVQLISLQETLNTVVHSIGSNEAILASKPNLRLVTQYDVDVPEFLVSDGRRLQQILYNLLGNALKFSEDGGIVEFGVSIIPPIDNSVDAADRGNNSCDNGSSCVDEKSRGGKVIHLNRQATAESLPMPSQQLNDGSIRPRIRFIVKDNGKGIAAKDFEAIFQPFSRASQETSNTYGGTGLGLSITARLVEALGGTISVDSKVGEWSKFTVDFPMRQWENSVNHDGMEPKGPTATAKSCNATVVDMGYLTSRLENATVCVVGRVRRLEQVFREYTEFDSVAELVANASVASTRPDIGRCAGQEPLPSQQKHTTSTIICLVQEDLVGKDVRSMLAKCASKTILLTFGPKQRLDGVDGHYRSLEQTLPSVLIKDLGDRCCHEASKKEVIKVNGERALDMEEETSIRSSTQNDDTTRTDAASPSPERLTKESLPLDSQKVEEGSGMSPEIVAATAIPPLSPFGHLRILIAEDNLVNQKVLARILDRLGVNIVDIADNGKKAVELEAVNPYDIVLMDVQMPVMDGIQACKLIRSRHCRGSNSEHALASVVFVTAQVSVSFEAEYFQAGAFDFLPKPCSMNGIRDCLAKYVETKRPSLIRSLSSKPNAIA